MRLLFTGKGRSGSYQIRAEQLGAALGATVKPLANFEDIASHDLTVVVKRVPEPIRSGLNGSKWVYDCVDCYPQPECSTWQRSEAIAWMRRHIFALNPSAVIWPNRQMREDCDDGRPGMVLPHHARPNQAPNPIREKVSRVGYEGRADYLQGWAMILHKECERRGWNFVVNPASLAELDIVVAFRGGRWDGYAPRHWKSGIKATNAHATGTPFVGLPESGYLEMASGAEYFAESPQQLERAFDWLISQSGREAISDRFRGHAYTIDRAVTDLKEFLGHLC